MSALPIVLTSGAWHGSWCWGDVALALAEQGIHSVAVELDGFGGLRGGSPAARWARPFHHEAFLTEVSPVSKVTVASAADSLIADLMRIGQGGPSILVAHSLGGVVATAVAEQAPELVAELIYVSGMAPVSGISAAEYNFLPEMSDSLLMANIVADPAATGALRCDFDDLSRRGHARQTLYNDLSDDHASRALSLLCSDAPVAVGVEKLTISRTRYGAVPHTYVVCNRDNALRPALQRRLIHEIDAVSTTGTKVAELDTSHSPFLSQPQALADIFAAAHRRTTTTEPSSVAESTSTSSQADSSENPQVRTES